MENNGDTKESDDQEPYDKGSNSCVMDLSIEGIAQEEEQNNERKNENEQNNTININQEEESSNPLNKSFDEKINFFKRFILKDDVENLLDLSEDEDFKTVRAQRGKTVSLPSSSSIKKSPKRKLLINNEFMSPLKLNNNIIQNNDYSKINKIECKSLDDKNDNDLLEYEGIEHEENIYNIKIFRKKMIEYKNGYASKTIKENEDILNIENVFKKNDILITKLNSRKNVKKKNNFWHKHILEQNRKFSIKINNENVVIKKKFRRSETINVTHNEGLFILGVLESAAMDRNRRRKSTAIINKKKCDENM